MSRLLVVAVCGFASLSAARGQCVPWHPVHPVRPVYGPAYPLSPAIWGAPAPKPLPPAPVPVVPKGAAVREEEDTPPKPADKPKDPTKAKGPEAKEIEIPRLPKLKVPLPGDMAEPDPSTGKPPGEKKEPPKPEATDRKEKAFDEFLIPAQGGRGEPKPEVKVGFFNHSEREVVLDVNGETVRLPSEQYVTLRLPRSFKWGEKGQKGTDMTVPPDADGIEIVFRK